MGSAQSLELTSTLAGGWEALARTMPVYAST